MENRNNELSRIIHARYSSEAEFTRAMGWSRQKMNKITTGKQLPDIAELNKMAELLDVDAADLLAVFLPEQMPKQKENALQEMNRIKKGSGPASNEMQSGPLRRKVSYCT